MLEKRAFVREELGKNQEAQEDKKTRRTASKQAEIGMMASKHPKGISRKYAGVAALVLAMSSFGCSHTEPDAQNSAQAATIDMVGYLKRPDGDYPYRLAEYIARFYSLSNRWPTNVDELDSYVSKAESTNLLHYLRLQLKPNTDGGLNVQYSVDRFQRVTMDLPKPQ